MMLRSSAWNGPRTSKLHNTGTTVTASSVEPTIANVFVHASGWNNLPSCPVSANTGTNARMMIAIAKKMGRPTCLQTSRVTCHVSAAVKR